MAVSRYVNGKPLYWHKWGLPNLQVIFLKDTQNKVDNLKAAFAKLKPEGSTQFLFNTFRR